MSALYACCFKDKQIRLQKKKSSFILEIDIFNIFRSFLRSVVLWEELNIMIVNIAQKSHFKKQET